MRGVAEQIPTLEVDDDGERLAERRQPVGPDRGRVAGFGGDHGRQQIRSVEPREHGVGVGDEPRREIGVEMAAARRRTSAIAPDGRLRVRPCRLLADVHDPRDERKPLACAHPGHAQPVPALPDVVERVDGGRGQAEPRTERPAHLAATRRWP